MIPSVEERERQERTLKKSRLGLIDLCRMEATKFLVGHRRSLLSTKHSFDVIRCRCMGTSSFPSLEQCRLSGLAT